MPHFMCSSICRPSECTALTNCNIALRNESHIATCKRNMFAKQQSYGYEHRYYNHRSGPETKTLNHIVCCACDCALVRCCQLSTIIEQLQQKLIHITYKNETPLDVKVPVICTNTAQCIVYIITVDVLETPYYTYMNFVLLL